MLFRLRINFQKHDRLRLLAHLELVRAMERVIRRAQLPYAVSQGFNAHMKHAPGPALPVGSAGLDEYFDVWLNEYIRPEEVLARLKAASVDGLSPIGVQYVPTSLRGLAATHVHEEYEVVLESDEEIPGGAGQVEESLTTLIAAGELSVARKKKTKIYDLNVAVEAKPVVTAVAGTNEVSVNLKMKSAEQGSVKPEVLIGTALGESSPFSIKSVTRTKLYSDEN
ncbi:MAG TPA: hypothetical protein DEB24_02260 [Coriobacteriia bacterium]|nr:hypothetical protein [Coriobacteriia bacterium]